MRSPRAGFCEFSGHATAGSERARASRAVAWLRLLRAHGILEKVPRTHRYQVTTPSGQALAAADATTAQLARLAA
ncbi:MAG: hypothetical protein JW751_30415 [Polyangiaceae bacterium]|nr:hypothetical protein [Polyangiaceae bacterium]